MIIIKFGKGKCERNDGPHIYMQLHVHVHVYTYLKDEGPPTHAFIRNLQTHPGKVNTGETVLLTSCTCGI